jgi:nitroreductase
MDVNDAIESRRAVKHFDPTYQMTDSEMERLLELTLLSPTAFNIQNWRFVLARDPELRRRLREVAWDQAQVTDASLLVVLCADVKAWDRAPERYWRNAPQEVQDFIVPAIRQYYEGREGVERDEAMRSCGLAAQTLMLAARGLGYDSCPMDGFDYEAVGKLINLPPDHVVAMFVAIGKGTKAAWPRGGQLDMGEVVLVDGFSAAG